jgi:uncharacterized protein YbjT (DUF2867 family)
MSTKHTVLVTGASGKQGSAVAGALLKRGHSVRAMSRNPNSEAMRRLAAKGAALVHGDFDRPETIVAAAQGADAGFLMGDFYEAGMDGEIRQGIAGADAMKQAGIGHLIYSSVGSANRNTGIPHFNSKYEVEQHIGRLGVPYTISAPVAFMENLLAPWSIAGLQAGNIAFPLPAERSNQLVSVTDLGAFVASIVERREPMFGKRYDVAGDELNGRQQAEILSRAFGRPVQYQAIPLEMVRQQSEDTAIMAEWFDSVGYDADIAALRRDFPEVGWHSFADWAVEFDWSVLDKATVAA